MSRLTGSYSSLLMRSGLISSKKSLCEQSSARARAPTSHIMISRRLIGQHLRAHAGPLGDDAFFHASLDDDLLDGFGNAVIHDHNIHSDISEKLSRGMTQEELAECIGAVKSTVAGYETGRSEPNMEKSAQIMSVLNIDANPLIGYEMAGECAQAPAFSPEALHLGGQFDRLDGHGKRLLRLIAEAEWERMKRE